MSISLVILALVGVGWVNSVSGSTSGVTIRGAFAGCRLRSGESLLRLLERFRGSHLQCAVVVRDGWAG